MVWYFIGVYIINRTSHGLLEMRSGHLMFYLYINTNEIPNHLTLKYIFCCDWYFFAAKCTIYHTCEDFMFWRESSHLVFLWWLYNKSQLASTDSNILCFHGRWVWHGRSDSSRLGKKGKENLLVTPAIIRIAKSINKWINTNGNEVENCCEMVECRIYFRFTRSCKDKEDLVWGITYD